MSESKRPAKWLLFPAAALMALTIAACSDGSGPATAGRNQSSNSSLSSAQLAAIFPPSNGQQVGISVSGAGSVSVTPDIVLLTLGVEAEANTVAAARASAATSMTAILKSLRDNGIQDKDVKTASFRIEPIYVYDNRTGMPPRITGYKVSNSVNAKVRAIEKVGDVVDKAALAGGDAIRINGIMFTVDDPKPMETQARDLAMKDAIAKARQIATLAGVKIGSPISISESSYSPLKEASPTFARSAADIGGAPTPINPGELEISISVQATFAID